MQSTGIPCPRGAAPLKRWRSGPAIQFTNPTRLRVNAFGTPRETDGVWPKCVLVRWQQGLPVQRDQSLLPGRAPRIESAGRFPHSSGSRHDEETVHRPVVVLAEGEPVRGMVISADSEGDEVSAVHEGQVGFGQLDAQSAGGSTTR